MGSSGHHPTPPGSLRAPLRERSNPLARRTLLPHVGLLCNGDVEHYAPMPNVYTDGPTGAVACGECGAPMSVVDVITVEARAYWSSLSYLARGRRYFGV